MLKKQIFRLGGGVLAASMLFFTGCNSSNPEQENNTLVKNSDEVYSDSAIKSNGVLSVGEKLEVEGSLSSISSRNINQSSSNEINEIFSSLSSTEKRSVSRTSSIDVETIDFSNGIKLLEDGTVFLVDNKKESRVALNDFQDISLEYKGKNWRVEYISGSDTAIYSETDIELKTNGLSITQPIYSQGDISIDDEAQLNRSYPYEMMLVSEGDIKFKDAEVVGKIHSNGSISAKNLSVIGSIEAVGDIKVSGDLNVEYLDNVYKAAEVISKENLENPNLIYSKIYKDLEGENDIGVFVYLKDKTITVDELNKIIANGNKRDYELTTVIVSAKENRNPFQMIIYSLAPFYENMLNIQKTLSKEYGEVTPSEFISISEQDLFITYVDSKDKKVGTYRVMGAMTTVFDELELPKLSQTKENELIEEFQIKKAELEKKDKEVKEIVASFSKDSFASLIIDSIQKIEEGESSEISKEDKKVYDYYNTYAHWNRIKDTVGEVANRFIKKDKKKRVIVPQEVCEIFYSTCMDHPNNFSYGTYLENKWTENGYTLWGVLTGFHEWMADIGIQQGNNTNTGDPRRYSSLVTTAMALKYYDLSKSNISGYDYSNNFNLRKEPIFDDNDDNGDGIVTLTLNSDADYQLKNLLEDIYTSFKGNGFKTGHPNKPFDSKFDASNLKVAIDAYTGNITTEMASQSVNYTDQYGAFFHVRNKLRSRQQPVLINFDFSQPTVTVCLGTLEERHGSSTPSYSFELYVPHLGSRIRMGISNLSSTTIDHIVNF